MIRCVSCDKDAPGDSIFCPWCATRLADATAGPTLSVRGEPGARARPERTPRPAGGSSSEGRFLPGTIIAGRYRIFGIVGKGGMGEVYRADDLKLGQTVALKFLPAEVEQDDDRLSRLLDEVRIARQISHPNVCRVYDVGEVDGHHFLSMEFVDGEDLASLLRRIGRLPRDKAIQIARQLCAGLAAAHDQNVLHRDLKPANVMIDGRGRARITDFGLARLDSDDRGAEPGAGTPAYMAPEQSEGMGATVRSDLYSLGLVLYELCTGQPAFRATTPAEMARLKSQTAPPSPGRIIDGFDPAVERVILRCLAREPGDRPATALQVAAALPGGDPIAAALAAGETPSPELVAEAGAVGGLTPTRAWVCAAALAAGIVLIELLAGRTQLTRLVPLDKPPEVLAERARELIRSLGYIEPAADSACGFESDLDYLREVEGGADTSHKWERLRAGPPYAIRFWYRQSPRTLIPYNTIAPRPGFGDPPLEIPGMVRVRLDPAGHLREFEAEPQERLAAADPNGPGGAADSASPAMDADWNALLRMAGLEPGDLRPVQPVLLPSMYADRIAAWEGTYAGPATTPFRVEASSLRGRPVGFRFVDPWTSSHLTPAEAAGGWQRLGLYIMLALVVACVAGGAYLARMNVRLGRGDHKGALRLAVFLLVTMLLHWALRVHLVGGMEELERLVVRIGGTLFFASLAWIFYLALEPYMRRLWPRTIVSWVRLLDGRFRDPLVGRDVLLGLLVGMGLAVLNRSMIILPGWFGLASIRPDRITGPPLELMVLSDLRSSVALIPATVSSSIVIQMAITVILLLARIMLRSNFAAVLSLIVVFGLSGTTSTGNPLLDAGINAVGIILHVVVLFRIGLLAIVVCGFASALVGVYPMTFDTGAWYSGNTVLALIVVAALAAYGFRTALAGRRATGEVFVPDVKSA